MANTNLLLRNLLTLSIIFTGFSKQNFSGGKFSGKLNPNRDRNFRGRHGGRGADSDRGRLENMAEDFDKVIVSHRFCLR